MSHDCLHHNAAVRGDPTRTKTLRRRYLADMNRRFNDLMAGVRKAVATDDVFGLRANVTTPPPGAFRFERPADKVASFMEWLREAEREGILETRQGPTIRMSGREAWQNIYIHSAYQAGLARAGSQLRAAGAEVTDNWIDSAFHRPVHADRVGLIGTRAFEQLRGITETMSGQMSRVLAQGLAEGRAPEALARSLNDRVEKIGRTRARVLARTEVIAAHAEATLNAYDEAGIEGVAVEAEWLTAIDPCPVCERLRDGGPYSIQKARNLIPAHPNCRCAWAPIVSNPRNVALR